MCKLVIAIIVKPRVMINYALPEDKNIQINGFKCLVERNLLKTWNEVYNNNMTAFINSAAKY